MEVFLYNSTVCRLCGEENDNGTLLYSSEENSQNLSEIINSYLPIKVSDDGQLPRTICPGCTIQIEATVEFITLIINGQKIIRELHQREREYKKTLLNNATASEPEIITEKIVYEINTSDGVYQVEHPIALQVAGLEKPKRKRGRPPKKPKSPEELAQEAAARQQVEEAKTTQKEGEEVPGKRRRKTPTRFKEAVQGKELERIFKEEGVTDGDESDGEAKLDSGDKPPVSKEPEVIGHMEASGELVVVVKGKGRGRPKGRMRPTREQCAICGMEFSCVGRYMSHVAAHGPVQYRCGCGQTFPTRLTFTAHQRSARHEGQTVLPVDQRPQDPKTPPVKTETPAEHEQSEELPTVEKLVSNVQDATLPAAVPEAEQDAKQPEEKPEIPAETPVEAETETEPETVVLGPSGKPKMKCSQCDKMFSNKQSRSLHIKAVHEGSRPYSCAECGASFAYPRSLALHAHSHRRAQPRGFACDLCGKVLNHPSSVVYHKEAEHAGQRYVCGKCGKLFKHKQLLQRHQLVHSQARPYSCKICSTSFKTKANLLNHALLHSGVKRFACELCKHRFAHKTSLTLHMRWHSGLKPFTCKTCGKSFSQKGNLSEHERIHTGEKPYQCTQCPRRFTTSSQHRLHARRHQADTERPHVCNHCGKRFVCRSSWLAHMRRETRGAARHRCGACGRAFAERWALLKHARRHTGERPFRCPLCPRAFADCSNLNKHKKQVHKQVSLLVDKNPPMVAAPAAAVAEAGAEAEADAEAERVIYVAYDADAPQAFHIVDPEQMATLDSDKVTDCELYTGSSLLIRRPESDEPRLEQVPVEQLEQVQMEQVEHVEEAQVEMELAEPIVLEESEHMPVTDEQGNPLHFTMQDGTRLAITSADGKSLQVITQDGQTIPVEINGFTDEEEIENPDTIVHQLNLQKTVDTSGASHVAHYFTIV